MPTFSNIAQLVAYINANIIPNGNNDITGQENNDSLNGLAKFIEQSPINWNKTALYSSGGAISLANSYLGVAAFLTTTPTSLSFGDNVYNQYVFLNLTDGAIPLGTPSAYYDLTGAAVSSIAANSALTLFKTSGNLWVQGNNAAGGGGTTQKEPKTYVVGTTSGAPTAGATTWTLPAFANSWVVLFLNGGKANQSDAGNGSSYVTKASLASDTITINNYTGGWVAGDVLDYILITP